MKAKCKTNVVTENESKTRIASRNFEQNVKQKYWPNCKIDIFNKNYLFTSQGIKYFLGGCALCIASTDLIHVGEVPCNVVSYFFSTFQIFTRDVDVVHFFVEINTFSLKDWVHIIDGIVVRN